MVLFAVTVLRFDLCELDLDERLAEEDFEFALFELLSASLMVDPRYEDDLRDLSDSSGLTWLFGLLPSLGALVGGIKSFKFTDCR